MRKLIPILSLLLFFTLAFASMLKAQENHRFTTEMINGEEIVVSYKIVNGDGTRNDYPPIWDDPPGGGSTMGIIVKVESNPRVNDVPLEAGDFIGGFYTDDFGELKCGGASPWPGNLGVVISLRGDNPETPEKDGFSYQEQIYFRVFSWERMKEYDVDIIEFDPDSPTTDKWISLGLSEVIDIQALVDFDFYISATANPLCIGNEVTLTANEFVGSTGNYTYSWSSDPPGFNYDIPNPPATIPDETTTYYLTVSDGSQVSDHFLTVDVFMEPQVSVSEDGTICEDQIFSLSAEATDYSTILWTTDGDGYFTNSNGFATDYYPGPGDKASGGVSFEFTAQPIAPCTMSATDFVNLTINKYPTVDAGPDMSGCADGAGVPVSATGIDFETIIWTTEGDGTFENPSSISTVYYPGADDLSSGDVDLDVCVYSTAPCNGTDCDEMNIEFFPGPSCNAPPQLSRCENLPIQLVGITSNNNGLLWTTEGDGTFDNPTIINAKYYAGENDKLTGQTMVTLNALPIEPCTVPATKDVTLIFFPLPHLSTFGEGTENLCPNENFLQLNADLDHYNAFSWSTNGDGTFSGANTLTPKYYPGNGDFSNGFFELELTAGPVSPCTLSQTFTLYTNIYAEPSVTIQTESGTASCGEIELTLQTIDVENVSWNTSGDGFFSDPSALTGTNYTPGPMDLLSPETVTISVEGISPCPGLNAAQDAVEIFFQDDVSVSAGEDFNICETENFPLAQAEASDYETIDWTTSGDGTFDNPAEVNPVYFPGPNDIAGGQVTLTITGTSILPCLLVDTDEMQLLISQAPDAEAGLDATICDTEYHQVENASIAYEESIFWETSGDGTFDNENNTNPVYFPGPGDIADGEVALTLNVLGIEPCGFVVSDSQVLTIQQSPVAFAGDDGIICANESYQIVDAAADNYTVVFWETSGDGNFGDVNEIDTEYFPGASDINTGNVVLTLHAEGINPCNFETTDSHVLNIQAGPVAEAGPDEDICETGDYQIDAAFAENYTALNWETSGDGTFSDPGILNPVYYPGDFDVFAGSATLTLHVTGIDPCNFEVSDSRMVTIQPQPGVDAGSDEAICNTGVLMITEAFADNTTSLNWETSGDGTFSDPASLTTLYVPGSSDINTGSVTLTLNAMGIAPCDFEVSDQLELSIQPSPVANAGPDVTICENTVHPIQGASAENYSAMLWLTSGDGTFSDKNILNPTYFPGPGDQVMGNVNLTLLATGLTPCYYPAIDEHQLFIQALPVADAGDDITSCDQATLSGTSENASSILWSTAGDGTFSDPESATATYYPGPGDLSNLSAAIQLTAFPLDPCTQASTDDLLLTFNIPTVVEDLEPELEVTTGELLQLEFVVNNPESGNFSWYKEGEVLPQYTTGTLFIFGVSTGDYGTYQCIFTNECGEVSSTETFIQVLDPFVQVISLEAGWQGISSFVEPDVTDVPLLFQPVENQVDILSDNQGFYWPEQSINTLGPWSNTSGYRLKMNADATLSIEGAVRYPRESLTIQPGWTYLPVISPCPLDVEELFGTLPSITIVKDMAGSAVYLPEYGVNNLENLEPGKAYQIYNSSDTPVIIELPECD